MPRGSSPKRERQYEHIKDSAEQRGESTGRAEEIASIVGWLSSEDAGFSTGAEYSVNGGLHMM